ncbi:MAG: GNAT family N-acetyltransferase [Candidatus Thorarchaeota archaeon]|jgi:ribosomal protein S18 acetylase RimI-like enzyme
MVEIKQKKWKDLDVRALAEITTEVRRKEGLGDYTVDQVEEYLRNMNERFPIEIALLAIDGEQILGWLGIERATEQIGEIRRWHPFVIQKTNQDDVARKLISEINIYGEKSGMTRMEIRFGGIDENSLATYEKRCSWFDLEGWIESDDTNFMAVNPVNVKLEEPTNEDGFKFRPLLEVDNETLFDCYNETFTTGLATWIHDMSEEEIRQDFEKSFDRSQNINEQASFVVEKDGEIVGFVLVKTRSDEEEHVESIGVHPSVRGKELGKLILWRVTQILVSQNANNLTLGFDPVNSPAVKLYDKFGFELVSRTASYSRKTS